MSKMVDARKPAAAGVFYPRDRAELARTVRTLLGVASQGRGTGAASPVRAIVAPHSPYAVSGAVAAAAWARILPQAAQLRRVVLLGPAHHLPFSGVAAPFADAFDTPLGTVPVDRMAIEAARRFPQLIVSDVPHEQEHSIEAQLPFVQSVLETSAIVPLIVGERSEQAASEVIDALWDDATLVVVSTDLSHYYDAGAAKRLDDSTARAVESLRPDLIADQQACGAAALRALLGEAGARNLRAARLALHHSGEVSAQEDEVIGFGAFSFS